MELDSRRVLKTVDHSALHMFITIVLTSILVGGPFGTDEPRSHRRRLVSRKVNQQGKHILFLVTLELDDQHCLVPVLIHVPDIDGLPSSM